MTDILPVLKTSAKSENVEDYNPSLFIGWRGLIRVLLFFNILGLIGIWMSASHAAEFGSELLLAPISVFAGQEKLPEIKPVPASLVSTKINTVITGHIVRTTVIQTFQNPSPNWMEGMFSFPLPDDSVVDQMVLKVGMRVIMSEIKEKRQAKEIYVKAAAEGKISALLTQFRPNMFSTRVANIEPKGTISIEISFQGLAKLHGTQFTWRMPQAITPRYTPRPKKEMVEAHIYKAAFDKAPSTISTGKESYDPKGEQNPTSFHILMTHAAKLASVSSPSHTIIKTPYAENETKITLKNGAVPADRDFILKWQFAQSDIPSILLFEEKQEDAAYTLGILLPPEAGKDLPEVKRDVTFIIDVSGSMHGTSIEQGQAALVSGLELLKTGDRFDIIAFNDTYTRLFGRSEPASPENISYAKRFVRSLEATNGTEMYPALVSALSDSQLEGFQRQILFLTDGAVSNEQEMFELVDKRLGAARLFTVGLGSAPNGWFMRKAAEFGRGVHIEISDLNLAQSELEELFRDMASPTLEKINLKFGTSADIYPKIIPDLFGQRPLVFVARHDTPVEEAAVTALLPFGSQIKIPLNTAASEENTGIAKLWAAKKVEGLTDALARGMDEEMVRTAVLDIALRHQIMSPYTSFVAVDKTPARTKDDFLKKMRAKGNLPHGMAWQKVQALQTATPMEFLLWSGLGAFLIAILLILCRRRIGWAG